MSTGKSLKTGLNIEEGSRTIREHDHKRKGKAIFRTRLDSQRGEWISLGGSELGLAYFNYFLTEICLYLQNGSSELSANFRSRRSQSVGHDGKKSEMRHSRNESYDELKVGSFPNDTHYVEHMEYPAP